MKLKEHLGEWIFTVFILSFLAIGFLLNVEILEKPWERFTEDEIDFEEWIDEVKQAYVADVAYKDQFINLNGLFAKLTGRTVYNNVATLKNGMLDYDVIPKQNMTTYANSLSDLNGFLADQNIPFLYIQAPFKLDMQNQLAAYGVENCGNQNADELLKLLKESGIDSLDLRQTISATPELVERYFYRTDHHWNTHGAFLAFGEAVAYLQAAFPDQTFDTTLTDPSNWNMETYEDVFLGSRGKRVGKYFGGVDDLVLYTPKFETDMYRYVAKYRAYYGGSFEDAVLCKEYLEKDYFNVNAYCAYIGGDYPLVHHVNRLAKNDLKVLLIKDSFSLPFQAFLSTAVRELDVLDPRYYGESTVAEYVAASNPDIVIVMTNPSVFGDPSYLQFGAEHASAHFAQTELVPVATEEHIRLQAPQGKLHWNRAVCDHLKYDTKYTLTCESIQVEKGKATEATVLLYNATTKTILSSYVFDLRDPTASYEWSFITPQSGDGDLRVMVYCGRHGSTDGNRLIYQNVTIYEHCAPSPKE